METDIYNVYLWEYVSLCLSGKVLLTHLYGVCQFNTDIHTDISFSTEVMLKLMLNNCFMEYVKRHLRVVNAYIC